MKITKFICGESSCVLYLIGPKGSSKSIFLMYACFKNNIRRTPTLYINYRKMKDLEIKQRKDIFKKEMIHLFFEEKTLRDFYKKKYYRKIKERENLMLCLKSFIQELISIYENTFRKEKIVLVIDNFDDDFDDNDNITYKELDEIIELTKKIVIK